MNVICEHPRIIIHPSLPELIHKYHNYTFLGEFHEVIVPRHKDVFDWYKFSVKRNKINHDSLESCYVVDMSTGERFPMYLEVPCGHCDICKVSKINSLVKRCEYETEVYNCKPWFITLTYDDDHYHQSEYGLPDDFIIPVGHNMKRYLVPKGGVNVRDCQLFLKRFRRNLQRAGYDFKIRYLLCAEYGKNTHRGHYHAIIWNIQSYTDVQYLVIKDILNKSWQNGYIMSRLIDPKDDKGFYYTSKYLKKDCVVPDGCRPCFVLSSRGNGGIGAPFIDSHADLLRKTLNADYKVRMKWTGKVENLQFSRYLIDRVFPSFCKSVSSKFRSAVERIILYGRQLSNKYGYENDYETFVQRYSPFFYTAADLPVPRLLQVVRKCEAIAGYNLALSVFEKFKDKIDLLKSKTLAEKRLLFLSVLFRYQHPIDLKSRASRCRDIVNYSSIYEVL